MFGRRNFASLSVPPAPTFKASIAEWNMLECETYAPFYGRALLDRR